MLKIRSFPRNLALTRLKSNLFFLFLALTFRSIFTPYRSIRHGIIWLLDEQMTLGYGARITKYAGLLLCNALQATWSLLYPPPPPSGSVGRSLTPSKPSSPLTRSYPPVTRSNIPTSSPLSFSTPTKSIQQRPSFQTPQSQAQNTSNSPSRPSPLSSSTAALLGLKNDTTPSKTGYYYRTIKKENGEEEVAPSATLGEGEGYVMVNSEEREWADNAWKGVRGKGGRIGL